MDYPAVSETGVLNEQRSAVVAYLLMAMMFLWRIWLNYWFAKQFRKLPGLRHQWRDNRGGFAGRLWFHNADVLCLRGARTRLIRTPRCGTGTWPTRTGATSTRTSWNGRMTGRLAVRRRRTVLRFCYVRSWTSSVTKHQLTTPHHITPQNNNKIIHCNPAHCCKILFYWSVYTNSKQVHLCDCQVQRWHTATNFLTKFHLKDTRSNRTLIKITKC